MKAKSTLNKCSKIGKKSCPKCSLIMDMKVQKRKWSQVCQSDPPFSKIETNGLLPNDVFIAVGVFTSKIKHATPN